VTGQVTTGGVDKIVVVRIAGRVVIVEVMVSTGGVTVMVVDTTGAVVSVMKVLVRVVFVRVIGMVFTEVPTEMTVVVDGQ
jgi:hypothetical protein